MTDILGEQASKVTLSRQLQVATNIDACFCIGCGQPDEPELHDPLRCPAMGGHLDAVPVATALEVYDESCETEPELDGEARALHCVITALSDKVSEARGGSNLFGPVQHEWVTRIPMMQQSVLFAAIRAPDGLRKNHPVKVLMRWYRRCVLLSAFDKRALNDPFSEGGGSFTGPFEAHHARDIFRLNENLNGWPLNYWFDQTRKVYLEHVDEIPHHFQLHLMHAAQIVGVHHPDESIREWWNVFYLMIVNDAHLQPETPQAMNLRLSDNCDEWRAREEVVAR